MVIKRFLKQFHPKIIFFFMISCIRHYVVKGPENTPYFGGYYHGTLIFPREFPFKPPAIYMLTPNGRFKTNTRLCLSISDFHPDTWNPAWSVGTILTGLLSFMLETTPTLGSFDCSTYERKLYAKNSLKFNKKNSTFNELFPDIVAEIDEILTQTEQKQQLLSSSSAVVPLSMNDNVLSASTQLSNKNNLSNDMDHYDNNGEKYFQQMEVDNVKSNSSRSSLSTSSSTWHTLLSNLIVVTCFGIFTIIVNYVIRSLNTD